MIGDSFKQRCPTCEAMVLVKNQGMVGKKMECPKCKDEFLVSKPKRQSSEEADEPVGPRENRAAKSKATESYDEDDSPAALKARKKKKKKLGRSVDDTRSGDEDDSDDRPVAKKSSSRSKTAPPPDDDEDGVEIHFEPKKKPAARSNSQDEDDDEDEKPAKLAIKKIPLKSAAPDDEDDDAPKASSKSKKALLKSTGKKPQDDDEDDEERKPAKKSLAKGKQGADDDDDDGLDDEDPKAAKKARLKGKAAADDDEEDEKPGKKKKSKGKAKLEDDEEGEDGDATEPAAKKSLLARLGLGSLFSKRSSKNGAKKETRSKPAKDDEEAEAASESGGDEGTDRKKKEIKIFGFKIDLKSLNLLALKAGSRKTAIGAGLAVVGVLVFAYAAYVIFFSGPQRPNQTTSITPGKGNPPGGGPPKPGTDPGKPATPPGTASKPGGPKNTQPLSVEKFVETKDNAPAPKPWDPSITNFLPAEAERVVHVNLANLFYQTPDGEARSNLDASRRAGPFYDAAFRSGTFLEKALEKKLGFSPLKVDELVHAESFSAPWSFTIVHLKEKLDMKRLEEALNLGKAEKDPRLSGGKKSKVDLDYFRVQDVAFLEQFGRLAPGFPFTDRQKAPRRKEPLYLHRYDAQTFVLTDGPQMFDYLVKVRNAAEKPNSSSETFTSLKSPEMVNMIHRLEDEKIEPQDRFMFMSVTKMQESRLPWKKGEAMHFIPRPFLDLGLLLEERSARVTMLGSALFSKDKSYARPATKYQYRTEVECSTEVEAKKLAAEFRDGEELRNLLEQTIKVNFETFFDPSAIKKAEDPRIKIKNPMMDLKFPPPMKDKDDKKDLKKDRKALPYSRMYCDFDLSDPILRVVVDLNLEPYGEEKPLKNAADYLSLLMADAHAELVLAEENPEMRRQLARAGNLLATDPSQKWRSRALMKDSKLPRGEFPPAAFPFALKNGSMEHDPGRRVSWMVALLPYLGHQKLYDRVLFNASWEDPSNWPAGRTLVPEFIDPTYPVGDRYVDHPGLGVSFAATHFVGIAGVGLDAGDPIVRADPSTRRGILGYDRSASLDEVSKGRGASTTMLMIQVPRNSLAGFTPWIAGGGYTLRGVPETRSIEPFIDKGSKGTFALMADGSVRFISSSVSDNVLKAMASYQGDTPADFEKEFSDSTRLLFEK